MADRPDRPPRDVPAEAPLPDAASLRARMVREQLEARGIRDAAVLAAMASVPRERFVPPALRRDAYDDGALSIGHGQTISQPWIVARMTEALQLRAWSAAHPGRPPRVLDVGTGSGYQAAVLAAMGASVVSIERDAELSRRAAATLGGLGVRLELVVGDGSLGHPPRAPYAAIVVAAAAPDVPRPLVEQLEDGGRLVLPIGPRSRQELTVVTREGDHVVRRELDPAVFVPLLGRYGQDSDPDA